MIAVKKICLKDKSRRGIELVEEAEIKKREEESEGLRLTGSQNDQHIIKQIESSRGRGLENFH